MTRTACALAVSALFLCMTASRAEAAIEPLPGCVEQSLPANDDLSTGAVDLGFTLTFFGTSYTAAHVNNNGNLTFTAPLRDFVPTPLASVDPPIMAPFWADVDTRAEESEAVTYGTDVFGGRPTFCVNWGWTRGVGYFNGHGDRLNQMQLLIVNRNDIALGNADLYLNYDQIQWDLGDFSTGISARWGFGDGAGAGFEGAGSAINNTLLDGGPNSLSGSSTNSGIRGRHIFRIRNPAPDTVLDVAVPPAVRDPQPGFSFSTGVSGSVFECRLDGAPFTPCVSPWRPGAALSDGTHVFEVRARSLAGVRDGTPASAAFVVDTVAPQTVIDSGPTGPASSDRRTFAFSSSDLSATFACSVDGAAFAACTSPFTTAPLSAGSHEFRVRAIDAVGNVDGSPASVPFTIPLLTIRDRDLDGVGDPDDNCPDIRNSGQADGDDDDVGDACEALPPGNRTPVAGEIATVRAVAGKVFVKVPRGTKLPPLPPGEPTGALDGYRSLSGVASVPVGSIIDARSGTIRLTTAAGYKKAKGKKGRQFAILRAAIFKFKQAQKRRRGTAQAAVTDIVIQTPPGKARACAAKPRPKGAVRRLGGTAKGIFRVVAGAGTMIARRATWITEDRCNGTVTRVVRGRVAVSDRGRTVRVRAGKKYLVRALLFQAKKRRRL